MTPVLSGATQAPSPDWQLDYYSRPILEADGRKRWELLICSGRDTEPAPLSFRWSRSCPAAEVNSIWLRDALLAALDEAADQGFGKPRRVRCWRPSMRPMIERAADAVGLEVVPSRRCYDLQDWLRQRESEVYPREPGFMRGPLAPPPLPVRPAPSPLPEAARGDSWSWARLPLASLRQAGEWGMDFGALIRLPADLPADLMVPGIRLFSRRRSLAIAGWLAGMEPVRLEIDARQLVMEAAMEDRWLLATLPGDEAAAAEAALISARSEAAGLQFLAVQSDPDSERFEGFWMLRDLPDG